MMKKYLTVSLLGHFILLLICTLYFSVSKKNSVLMSETILSANLVTEPLLSLYGLHKKNSIHSHKTEIHTESPSQKIPDPLLQIIHNAIAAKQVYPDIAQQLNQSGVVKIGFWLDPHGQLSQISLLKSSGFPNIDQAALNAVNDLSSIQAAGIYLKNREYMAVDVVFEL
jgi:TonB family protein